MAQSCFRFELHCAWNQLYQEAGRIYQAGLQRYRLTRISLAVSFPFLTYPHDPATLALDEPPEENSTNRMLKKSAIGVLVSLRGSTYRSVRLASSLAAALLDSLFEHPEVILVSAPNGNFWPYVGIDQVFPQSAGDEA